MRRLLLVLMGVMLVVGSSIGMAGAADQTTTTSIVVKMVKGLSAAEQAVVIARDGGTEKSAIPALRLHVITAPTASLTLVLKDYQGDSQVESVEVNKSRKAETLADDQHSGVQWSLPKIGWDQLYGKVIPKGTARVALLDTGIDATHPDLKANVMAGTSILDGTNGLSDPSGHGTQMAGIVAAVTGNTLGISGIAYSGVKIMPVTVLDATGTGQDSDIIQGIIWATDNGADVILMAFSNPDFSQHLQDAIDYAWARGIVLVAATGNGGGSTPTFPAGDRGVIGISATDENDTLAASSNYGDDTFLAAPGTNIYTTTIGGSYSYISGTSTSAAVVAGVAAFMKANDPTLANGVILGRLVAGADTAANPGDPDYKLKYGYGRVSMAKALAGTITTPVEPVGALKADTGPVGPYAAAAAVKYYNNPGAATSVGTDGSTNMTAPPGSRIVTVSATNSYRNLATTTSPTGTTVAVICANTFSNWTGTDQEMFRLYTPKYTDSNRNIAANVGISTDIRHSPGGSASLKVVLYEYNDTTGIVGSAKGTYTTAIALVNDSLRENYSGSFNNTAFTVANGNRLEAIYYTTSSNAAPYILWGSAQGTNSGNDSITVTESAVPVAATATTGSATGIGTTSATLNGTINANGSSTTATFEYGTSISYGSSVTATQSPVTGASPTSVSASITGLTPGLLYHFRVKGVNVAGTSTGSDATFTADSTLAVTGPSSVTYPATGTLQSSGGLSGGAVTYDYVSGGCSLSGATVTITDAGSTPCVVTATVAAGGSYLAQSSVNFNVTLNKATPTVTVTPGIYTYNGSAQGPGAAETTEGGSTGGLTFSYLGTGGTTYATSSTKPTAAGTYSVTATAATDSNNNTASSGATPFSIGKATPGVSSWPTASAITYGRTLADSSLTGGASVPAGSFTFTTPGAAPNAGTNSQNVTFTPTNTFDYATVSGSVNVLVNKADPTIAFNALPVTVGGSAPVSATGGSGSFTYSTVSSADCSVSGANVTGMKAGVGNCVIKADQIESANYNAGTLTQSFSISLGNQTITFAPSPTTVVGGNGAVSASATSGLAVAYATTSPDICILGGVNNSTVTGVKGGTCTIAATQPGNGSYSAAPSATQSFTVGLGRQTITFGAAPNLEAQGSGIVTAGGGTSGNPVVFSSLTPDVCTTGGTNGATVTGLLSGACTIAANQAGVEGYYNAAPQTTQNLIITPKSQVSVVIQTIPSGLTFTVTDSDGTHSYTSPHLFAWVPGATHTVAAGDTQPGITGVRYLFNNWSDGGAMTHAVTAPAVSATYTAAFATQYQLTTTTDGHGTAIPAQQWYNAGDYATILATPSSGYIFSSWTLTGGAGVITNPAAAGTSVAMNGPTSVNGAMAQLAPANLSATIVTGNKIGIIGGIRSWPITIQNSGSASADGVTLNSVTLSASGACKPTATTDSLLPLPYGTIAGPGSVTQNIQVNFAKCPSLTKFTVTVRYSATGGISGSNSFTGVTQ